MPCGRGGGTQPASAPSFGSCRKRDQTPTTTTHRRRRSCRPPSLAVGAASVSKRFCRRRPPSPPSVVAGSRKRARRAEAFGSWALYARRALKPNHHLTTWPGNVFAAWLGGRRWDELQPFGRRTRSRQRIQAADHALTTPSNPGEHGRRFAAAAEAQQRIRSLQAEPQARRAKPEPPLRRALCRMRAGPTRAPPAAAAGRARGGFPSAYARAPSAARAGRAGCPCPSRRARPSPPLDPPLPQDPPAEPQARRCRADAPQRRTNPSPTQRRSVASLRCPALHAAAHKCALQLPPRLPPCGRSARRLLGSEETIHPRAGREKSAVWWVGRGAPAAGDRRQPRRCSSGRGRNGKRRTAQGSCNRPPSHRAPKEAALRCRLQIYGARGIFAAP
jgi:hypothetical protein